MSAGTVRAPDHIHERILRAGVMRRCTLAVSFLGLELSTYRLQTLGDEVRAICSDNDIGASDFVRPIVYIMPGKHVLGTMSYNGRVWAEDGTEVKE